VRLYSPEWVAAFNEAVAELVPEPGVSFRMHQIVDGGPEGTLRVTLDVGIESDEAATGARGAGAPGAGIVLRVERGDTAGTGDLSAGGLSARSRASQVTVVVAYDDATALARGDTDPAALLRAGRVKVRGDLSVLVAGQKILADAATRLGSLSKRTTF
jgi:hypothetical protein